MSTNTYSFNTQNEVAKDEYGQNFQSSVQGPSTDHSHATCHAYSSARNRSLTNNEQTALCRSSARSDSNFSVRKEKKTSVGYKLGKRKLLFEKSNLIMRLHFFVREENL
jgi:hypothetical protein